MASAYVCSTCRVQLSRQKPRITRLLSHSANTKQQHGQGIGSLLEGDFSTARTERAGRHEADHAGAGVARGRYSGKELKPEELLGQVDRDFQSHVAAEGHRRAPQRRPTRPQYSESTAFQRQSLHQERVTTPIPSKSAPPIHRRARQFVAHAQSHHWVEAWVELQALESEGRAGGWNEVRSLFRLDGFEPSLRRLLHHATKQWLDGIATGMTAETQPSPVDILMTLHTLGTSKTSFARPLLWQASSGLAELQCGMTSAGANNPSFVNGLRSLANMWRVVMATYSKRRRPDSTPPVETSGWGFLPPASVFDQQVRRSHEMFEQMLGMLVPMPQLSDSTRTDSRRLLRSMDYASSALITLDLLRSVSRSSPGLLSEPDISPFVGFFEALLKIAPTPRIPYSFQEKISTLQEPALVAHYKDMSSRLGLQGVRLLSPNGTSEAVTEDGAFPSTADPATGAEIASGDDRLGSEPHPGISPTERFALVNAKRLGRALEVQDMLLAEKIKRETYAFAGSRGTDSQALPLELYEHLMLTFLSLRNPKAAIEVWNHVIQAGYKPTVKTYTTMMRGAQAVRDISGMKAFWHKMRKAGLQPDEHAWSIRIFGLFKLQLIKEGFQAMSEMSQEWLAAAKARAVFEATREQKKQMVPNSDLGAELLARYPGPVDGVPRPNLVVVNSAISSLALSQRGDIPKALTWARTFGIEPDVTTYNVLLNVAMRYEQTVEALSLLRRMQQRGIAANSTTWTVLLTALFEGGFLEDLDHKQQQDKILAFIDSLETNDPNMPGIDVQGYALVMNRLLKHHDNPDGAAAVMKHMLDRGHEPTTYIYTILMSSYFQCQPQPDFAAIEALWKQMESKDNGYGARVDSVFYDRMIEGYATHHRVAGIDKALGFLRRCRAAGQKPGWRALEAVARALADRKDSSRLQRLVDEVRISLRESRGASQHMGQRNFWRFIIEDIGMLREEGITKPEDILPRHARQSPLLQAESSA